MTYDTWKTSDDTTCEACGLTRSHGCDCCACESCGKTHDPEKAPIHDMALCDECYNDAPCDHIAHEYCHTCDGSGEGYADGTKCRTCGGGGETRCGECS